MQIKLVIIPRIRLVKYFGSAIIGNTAKNTYITSVNNNIIMNVIACGNPRTICTSSSILFNQDNIAITTISIVYFVVINVYILRILNLYFGSPRPCAATRITGSVTD